MAEQTVSDSELMSIRLHVQALVRWHNHCDAILHCIRNGGTLVDVCNVVVEWLDNADAMDDDGWKLYDAAILAAGGVTTSEEPPT